MFGLKLTGKNVTDLAKSLAEQETVLVQKLEQDKQTLREMFVTKLRFIFQTKEENVKLLNQSIDKITEKRDTDLEEMELAKAELDKLELEGK